MRYFLFLISVILLSCNNTVSEKEIADLNNELSETKKQITFLKSQIEPEGNLIHIVFFKLKPDADQNAFSKEVKKLATIKEVMDFQFGTFEDLGDKRALSEFNMMMEMSFKDKAAYQAYQQNPIHLALKENTKPFLAGPPATYDYMKR